MKKFVVLALIFGSNLGFAGTMGPASTPEQSAWDFGAQALYLQTSVGTAIFPDYVTLADSVQSFQNTGNLWGWGFMLEGSYHFGVGKDINLNWYHLNNDNTDTQTGPGTLIATGQLINGPLLFKTKSDWDAVHLEYGQRFDYALHSSVRFHGGVEYVHLDFHRDGYFTNPNGRGVRKLNYNGFGPRIGVDGLYGFNNGFSIYAKGAIALVAGTTTFKSRSVYEDPALNAGHQGSALIGVPELEAKIGAAYTQKMAHGDLSLDAGWLWINYYNVFMNGTPGEVHAEGVSQQGPYVGLKWVGNFI